MRIAVFVRRAVESTFRDSSNEDIERSEKVALAEASKMIKLRGGDVEVFAIGDKQMVSLLGQLYGATHATLLSDDMFTNLDVYSKADLLISAIRKSRPFDLIMFGEYLQDDPDWLLPYLVADKLNLPHIPRAIRAWSEDSRIICECVYYESIYLKESRVPVVVSMLDALHSSVAILRDVKPKEVTIWDSKFLGIKEIAKKLKVNETKNNLSKRPTLIEYNSYDDLADKIVDLLRK